MVSQSSVRSSFLFSPQVQRAQATLYLFAPLRVSALQVRLPCLAEAV
jgi:hypothetical protein